MSGFRLNIKTKYVDTSKPIKFTFDGKEYSGYEGDTLASALLANGELVLARSFKYHRPRGVYSAGSEEPNALVSIRNEGRLEPNCTATTIPRNEKSKAAIQCNRCSCANTSIAARTTKCSTISHNFTADNPTADNPTTQTVCCCREQGLS